MILEDSLKIKFCGITNREDYQRVVSIGADYIGFIFHPKSPRSIELDQLRNIISSSSFGFKKNKIKKVGVFVNNSIKNILTMFKDVYFDVIQLHGDETVQYVRKLQEEIYKLNLNTCIWKAFRINKKTSELEIKSMIQDIKTYPTNNILLENFIINSYGGTGIPIDNDILSKLLYIWKKNEIERITKSKTSFILAGGLNKDNLSALLSVWKKQIPIIWPRVLDFNSGVEVRPGKKKFKLMKDIIKLVENYKHKNNQ